MRKKDDAVLTMLTEHGRVRDGHRAHQEDYSAGRNIVVEICVGHGEPKLFHEMRH